MSCAVKIPRLVSSLTSRRQGDQDIDLSVWDNFRCHKAKLTIDFLFSAQKNAEREYEAQKKEDELTEAELEEQAVLKRRAEGTPCTKENFEVWKESFEREMSEKAQTEEEYSKIDSGKKQKEKKEDKTGRLSGFQLFSGKGDSMVNMDDMERAAEEAADQPIDPDELDVDEDLFDLEDDEDLDDLDFDEDEEDDEEEEPQI